MPNQIDVNTRQYFDLQYSSMDLEYETFRAHYKRLSEAVQPTKGRFFVENRNKGWSRWQEIVNNIATQSLRVATSGMFSGTMNPARPWMTLDPPDPAMKEFQSVKQWLDGIERLLFRIFDDSNLYIMAPQMIKELILFGTGAMHHDDDFQDVARFYAHTAGSYRIAQNARYIVHTLAREFQMTTLQMVQRFGIENVDANVRNQFERAQYNTWHTVRHFIEENPNFNPNKRASKFKAFRSVYYQLTAGNQLVPNAGFLRERGYDEFPAYVPRWDVTGEDIYATDCPGMTALGDTRQLQLQERRKAQAIDKEVNPPLSGPGNLRQVQNLPGGLTKFDQSGNGQTLQPIYRPQMNLQNLREDMRAVEERIRTSFFNDLFFAISSPQSGIQPKNQLELTQRDEERLIQLGPVLQRIHQEFLGQLVVRTFNQAVRAGIVPPAPPELRNAGLQVRFVSALAMAQRAVERNQIESTAAYTAGLANVPGWEQVTDKFDADESVDQFAALNGTPPTVIVPDEIVVQKRNERAQAQREQNEAQLAQQAAQTAKLTRDAQA